MPREEILDGIDGEDDDCDGVADDPCDSREICGTWCCVPSERCVAGTCVPPEDCSEDGDCENDTRCSGGTCMPYGPGDVDEECIDESSDPIPVFDPELQCAWTGSEVWVPPLVADLDADGSAAEVVVIAVRNIPNTGGDLLAIDGATCAVRWRSAAPLLHDLSPISIGDLDDDGHLEIAARKEDGGVAIFDDSGGMICDGDPDGFSNDPALATAFANVDGAGDSEVLLGLAVFDSACAEVWSDPEFLSPWGNLPVVADVDLDGQQEVLTGNRIFDAATGEVEEDFSAELDNGLPAIGDFDRTTPEPEIAVVAPTGARIQTIEGDVLFGPVPALFHGRLWGGAPTVADFDGDGGAEFAAAGASEYVVFDPDCWNDWPRGGDCASGRTDGILWRKESHDWTSGATGSSVFDFDGDGTSEAVFGDECFLRIYDGVTGDSRFVVPNANGTAYEYPTIADVDADGHSELVVGTWGVFGLCGDPDEETGTPFEVGEPGVRIWRDAEDRWVGSRPLWNQHAYSVTNVSDDGSIPAVPTNNWEVAGRNDFRVNQAIGPVPVRGVDLTVRGEVWIDHCPESIELGATVANRGTRRSPGSVEVRFYEGSAPEAGGTPICSAFTKQMLEPGDTETVRCSWLYPPAPGPVWIRVDPRDLIVECEEGNNDGTVPRAGCEVAR